MKLGRLDLRVDPPLSDLEIVVIILGSVPVIVAALLMAFYVLGISA